jgi:hypothetical protein
MTQSGRQPPSLSSTPSPARTPGGAGATLRLRIFIPLQAVSEIYPGRAV